MIFKTDPIPVKSYVKKFIEEGNLIKPYVADSIYRLLQKSNPDLPPSENTITVKLHISETVFQTYGWRLNAKNIAVFNSLMEGYIKDRFECELEANIRRSIKEEIKFPIQEMIIELRKKFKLDEEDMPLETIKKSLQRFCDSENIEIDAIKIFFKYVPKTIVSIVTNPHTIKSKELIKKLHISVSTYTRWKKKGIIYAERIGRWDMVNIEKCDLPSFYQVKLTQYQVKVK